MSVAIPNVDAGGFDIPDPETDLSEADRHIRQWIEGKVEESDAPHRDADVLMHLYWDREMPQARVAEELDCGAGTVSEWTEDGGIPALVKQDALFAD